MEVTTQLSTNAGNTHAPVRTYLKIKCSCPGYRLNVIANYFNCLSSLITDGMPIAQPDDPDMLLPHAYFLDLPIVKAE